MAIPNEIKQGRGSPEPTPGKCGAKLRGTNPPRYCLKDPLAGCTRCRFHGGKSPAAGPTHPRFSTGRYSKFLPEHLRARVAEAASDPELLSIRRQVEIVDLRFTMLLERLHSGESGSLWSRLLERKGEFQSAQAEIQRLKGQLQSVTDESAAIQIQNKISNEQQAAAEALSSMMKTIDAGVKDESAWREMIDLSHELAQFKRAEVQSEVQLRQVMTAEQAMVFVMNVQQAIADTVKDPKEKAAIGLRLAQLLGRSKDAGGAGNVSSATPAAQPIALAAPALALAQIAPTDSPAPAGQGGVGEGSAGGLEGEIIEGAAEPAD